MDLRSEQHAGRTICAIARLLSLKGPEISPARVLASGGGDTTPDGLVRTLKAFGVKSRAVRYRSRALSRLPLPTLVTTQDGAEVVLQVGRKFAVLETMDGPSRVEWSRLALSEQSVVLDLTPGLATGGSFLRQLWSAAVAERRHMLPFLLVSVLMMLVNAAPPFLAQAVMDIALPQGRRGILLGATVGTMLLAAQRAWLGWMHQQALRTFSASMERTVQSGMFERILQLPFERLRGGSVGSWSQILQSAGAVQHIGVQLGLRPSLDVSLLLIHSLALFYLVPPFAVVAMGLLCVAMLAEALGSILEVKIEQRELDAGASQASFLVELVTGAAAFKAGAAERRGIARWLDEMIGARQLSVQRERVGLWTEVAVGGVKYAMLAAGIFIAGSACIARELTLGGFVAAMMFSDGLLLAGGRLAEAVSGIWTARAHLDRVKGAGLEAARPAESRAVGSPARHEGHRDASVVLKNVWFRYDESAPWALQDYSLKLEPGEYRVLSGASGTGKSTVLRLIAGMLSPARGTVFVAGAGMGGGRSRVIYLPQDIYLYEDSILGNLELLSGTSLDRIMDAARRTGLDAWVSSLPMKYSTRLPPGGESISGGQRQLIALTAAVASERSIVLLDEAFSHLDPEMRAALGDRALFEGRTVLAVSHELTKSRGVGRDVA